MPNAEKWCDIVSAARKEYIESYAHTTSRDLKMALKDILVHVDATDPGKNRLRMAADLATRHGARLTVLHVRAYSIKQQHLLRASELGLVPGDKTDGLNHLIEDELDADTDDLCALLEQLRQDLSLDALWSSIEGQAHKLVPQHSRYADLTIIGHRGGVENSDSSLSGKAGA
jgi:nucleotide-binding universal stress UspA family protein